MTDEIVVLELRDTTSSARPSQRVRDRAGPGCADRVPVLVEIAPDARAPVDAASNGLSQVVRSGLAPLSGISGRVPGQTRCFGRTGPPGCHSTSPSGLATRDRMNSRSESRFRYFAGSTLTES